MSRMYVRGGGQWKSPVFQAAFAIAMTEGDKEQSDEEIKEALELADAPVTAENIEMVKELLKGFF